MDTKICKRCMASKPISSFGSKGRRLKNGQLQRSNICRKCVKSASSANNQCVECSRPVVSGQRRCEFHGSQRSKYVSKKRAAAKRVVFDHYGPKCNYCGESREVFLTLDHVNDDGNVHRRTVSTAQIYHWLVKNEFPDEFQILCYNCNCAKAKIGEAALLELLARG